MKLSRITASSFWGRPELPIAGRTLRCGKVYPTNGLEETLESFNARIDREEVGETPPMQPPKTLHDLPEFCSRWISWLLQDLLAADLGAPSETTGPLLADLRSALERMPEAPALPEYRRVEYADLTSVANELKRYRDWAKVALAEMMPPQRLEKKDEPSPDETTTDWSEFRNNGRLNGDLLTVANCEVLYNLSGKDLSLKAKKDPSIRKKNPSGRGNVYRWTAVRDLSEWKSRNM